MLDGRATHVETGSYGTPTHAAPELLQEGRLSPAVDLYAFGILGESLLTAGAGPGCQQRPRLQFCASPSAVMNVSRLAHAAC